MKQNFSGSFSSSPLKDFLLCAYAWYNSIKGCISLIFFVEGFVRSTLGKELIIASFVSFDEI